MKSDFGIGKDEVNNLVGTVGVCIFFAIVVVCCIGALSGVGLITNHFFEFVGVDLVDVDFTSDIKTVFKIYCQLIFMGLLIVISLIALYFQFEKRKEKEQIKEEKRNCKSQKKKEKISKS